MSTRQRLQLVAAIAALLSLALLWGSMRVARMPLQSENLQMAAYFQFLLFEVLAATALVALLGAFKPASRPLVVLAAFVAAFAVVVASFGLLMLIGVFAGHQVYQSLGLAFPFGVAALSIATYLLVAQRGGVGLLGSWLGAIFTLTFVPAFYVGAPLFCVLLTPNCRVHF